MNSTVLGDTDTAKRDILIHEFGHFIGLHEQYTDNDLFENCGERHSVMNKGIPGTLENCSGAHKPTTWDISAVEEYWLGEERLSIPVLSKSGSSTVKMEWKDNMWADGCQLTTLFNWDWDTWSWIQLDSPLFNEGIGFHKDSINRTLVKEWDIQENDWAMNNWYLGEVRHRNWRTQKWGPQLYSNYIYVP